jgi:hypothetical protein
LWFHISLDEYLKNEARWKRNMKTAIDALQEIKKQGKVCDDFEICSHPACQSSYAAWEIADTALRSLKDNGIE